MAVGAKRLIPRCAGASILLPGALTLFVCPNDYIAGLYPG